MLSLFRMTKRNLSVDDLINKLGHSHLFWI